MKRKRLLIFAATAITLSAACGVGVYAQTLAGTSAAIGAGATLGAAGGAGFLTPSQYAAPATGAGSQRNALMDETGGDGAQQGAAGGAAAQPRAASKPIRWSNDSGSDMLRQLTQTRTRKTTPAATSRTARSARRIGRMTKAQRTKAVNAKYQKPAAGYLSWYLPEDRYKVTSKVWQFVTTPNDRFYYRPWAPAMKLRSPSRVIGFHTWQDAMIAGYRPDLATKPEPGPQLAYMASLTRGPMLSTYVEYVYAGQVTPTAFEANYKYVRYVAGLVGGKSHTRHLVGSTVDQVIGAIMGQNAFPQYVGGAPRAVQASTVGADGMPQMPDAGGIPSGLQAGNAGSREDQYNQFGQRAGGLARKPGQ